MKAMNTGISLLGLLSLYAYVANGACDTAKDCKSCNAETAECTWCEYTLTWENNVQGPGIPYHTGFGICSAGSVCPRAFPPALGKVKLGLDPVNHATPSFKVIASEDCPMFPEKLNFGAVPANNSCQACGSGMSWCAISSTRQPAITTNKSGGSCIRNELLSHCKTSTFAKYQGANSSRLYTEAFPSSDCCSYRRQCDDCIAADCRYCAMRVQAGENDGVTTDFARCTASTTCDGPIPAGIAKIFDVIPMKPSEGSVGVVDEVSIQACSKQKFTGGSWYDWTSPDKCGANRGDVWCNFEGTFGGTKIKPGGGMCMSMDQAPLCTDGWSFYVGKFPVFLTGTKVVTPVVDAGSSAYVAGPAAMFAAVAVAAAFLA